MVHVYVDASASKRNSIVSIFGALRLCKEWVYPTVHLFSTVVGDGSLRDFLAGKVRKEFGLYVDKDIDCVANHIEENNIKRACLVTNGFVGEPRGKVLKILSKTKIGVIYTDASQILGPLDKVSDKFVCRDY